MAGKPMRGASRQMRDVVQFAEDHGFEVCYTKSHHLKFTGHGAVVIGPACPRNPLDAKKTQAHLQRVMALRAQSVVPA